MASASSMTTWEEVVPATQQWARETDTGFSVRKVDDTCRRVVLADARGSFYVAPPEEQGDSWVSLEMSI